MSHHAQNVADMQHLLGLLQAPLNRRCIFNFTFHLAWLDSTGKQDKVPVLGWDTIPSMAAQGGHVG